MRIVHTKQSDHVRKQLAQFHRDTILELEENIRNNDVVVIGMATNPHVKKAQKILQKHNIAYNTKNMGATYLRGNSVWRSRCGPDGLHFHKFLYEVYLSVERVIQSLRLKMEHFKS